MLHSSKTPTWGWNADSPNASDLTYSLMTRAVSATNALHDLKYDSLPQELVDAVKAAETALQLIHLAISNEQAKRAPGIHNDCLNFAIQHEIGCKHKELIDNLRQALAPPPPATLQFAADFVSNRR